MAKRSPTKVAIVGFVAAAVLALATAGVSRAQGPEMLSYNVTVENLTSGQPFTPPLVAAHSDQVDVFEVGEGASEGVMQVAENGNAEPLVAMLSGSDAVWSHVMGDGPVLAGESATVTIQAPQGSLLSVVFMLICTNDGFSGVDSRPMPASGSATVEAGAYDAGTEQNTEDFADIVPPCQELVGVSSDDEGTGVSNPNLAERGIVAMHSGIVGGTDLTVNDHGWTEPVARITVSVKEEAVASLPIAGTGPADGRGSVSWLVYLGISGAALFAVGGALELARRPRR